MSRNPLGSEPHRFAVEELLDLYPVVRRQNSQAPVEELAGASQNQTKRKQQQQSRASIPKRRVRRKGKKFE